MWPQTVLFLFQITMLADPKAEFTKAMNMDLDCTKLLGNVRSKRWGLISRETITKLKTQRSLYCYKAGNISPILRMPIFYLTKSIQLHFIFRIAGLDVKPCWLSGINLPTTISLACQHLHFVGCELETYKWQVCSTTILIDKYCQLSDRSKFCLCKTWFSSMLNC